MIRDKYLKKDNFNLQNTNLSLPGVAVQREIVGSVVQSVFLDEHNIWEAVFVDSARLPALKAHMNERGSVLP